MSRHHHLNQICGTVLSTRHCRNEVISQGSDLNWEFVLPGQSQGQKAPSQGLTGRPLGRESTADIGPVSPVVSEEHMGEAVP